MAKELNASQRYTKGVRCQQNNMQNLWQTTQGQMLGQKGWQQWPQQSERKAFIPQRSDEIPQPIG